MLPVGGELYEIVGARVPRCPCTVERRKAYPEEVVAETTFDWESSFVWALV